MKRLFACALLCVLLGPVLACAGSLAGVVIVVIDGDTVLFKPDHYAPGSRAFLKVRLAGIDAPESDQPHGAQAARALRALALKRHAQLEIVGVDPYGRKLGLLDVAGLQLNAELVRRGHAWASSRSETAALRRLQDEAREARRGLWQSTDPMSPANWRRSHQGS
ncbi:MAG: thermonuclease family protein [Pseudomonadota bacterium]